MTTRLIQRMEEFQSLRAAWNELVETSESDRVYHRHEWYETWIRAHRVERDLAVPTVWRDGQLVAVAPIRRTDLVFRGLRARSLAWLWSAEAPRCNFVVAEKNDIAALLDSVLAISDWHVFVAENLPARSVIGEAFLSELRRRDVSHQIVDGFQSPYRVLEESSGEFWEGLDRDRRRYLLKKCINRFRRIDGPDISTIRNLEAFESFLPMMYAISDRSWKAASGTALTPDSAAARLLVGFARAGIHRGWVRVDTLRIEGVLVAFEYMLVGGGRYVVARSDYDRDYKYFSPGNSLRLQIIQALLDDPDAIEYDLAGDDAPYKREWCNRVRSHVTVTVGNRTLLGRAVLATKNTLLPALRRLRGRGGDGTMR